MLVTDEGLRRALQELLQRPVRTLTRREHPYGSSHAIEDVVVMFDDGPPLELVFKDVLAPGAHADAAKPARQRDPERELVAYRDVLAPAGLDAAWDEAARWLAKLHARPVPTGSAHLLRYDEADLRARLDRAIALTPPGALDGVAAVWQRVVARLASWPLAVVHGDFHPSNILVQHRQRSAPRVRPVDWELAGIGPGLLDLAALTSGAWSTAERRRIALAYGRSLPPHLRRAPDDLLDALAHCRLFLAVQWLGWSADWSPPTEHAHDWLADATALAAELGP